MASQGFALLHQLRAVVRVVLLGLVVVASACTGDDLLIDNDGDLGDQRESVVVTRGDIVSVITLSAVVRAAPMAYLTTPYAGLIDGFDNDAVRLTAADGSRLTLAPPSGAELVAPLAEVGQRVPGNFPVAQVRLTGFGLVAEIDETTIYRLYEPPVAARGEISQGPGPFDCPLVSGIPSFADLAGVPPGGDRPGDAPERPSGQIAGTAALSVTCVVPSDLTVFEGMPAILALTTAEVHDVLTLPVEAVAGSAESGTVLLEGSDGIMEQEVSLGPTDGVRIQIIAGLDEGDRVTMPAPDLDGISP